MSDSFRERKALIQNRIQAACKKSGRHPSEINIIAVSKTKPAEAIYQAHLEGQISFGENYTQELLDKQEILKDLKLEWHFIGHLQRRKAREIVGKVDTIHSLDSYQLAYEIEKLAKKAGKIQKCLLQVNLSSEDTKSGIHHEELSKLLTEISNLAYVKITGLMTLPALFENPEEVRPFFQFLRELRNLMNASQVYKEPLTELSMGMSHDFEMAIEEGATMVRIGTALFGER
ncbi:MAG TPA: YggS family pyridoxal phosphate-dependent enzyme [Deltaproteobacteria bacterium]|nr:MAG: YggS family pyridoxal phosphate enzyme [Deltaproteobacteria bacterium GWA2_45_12]HBF13680.1 YggS family pyridoxal phosphate-dependent enzyme [Deltaproteobacteria bacterium]